MSQNNEVPVKAFVIGIAVIVLVMAGVLWAWPHYRVWQRGLAGQANLRQAEQDKLIAVETAKARMEAAKMEAQAEIEHAKGFAESIKIVGEMAQMYPEYRHQRFIEGFSEALREGKIQQIVYVPTETCLPIVESAQRRMPQHPENTVGLSR